MIRPRCWRTARLRGTREKASGLRRSRLMRAEFWLQFIQWLMHSSQGRPHLIESPDQTGCCKSSPFRESTPPHNRPYTTTHFPGKTIPPSNKHSHRNFLWTNVVFRLRQRNSSLTEACVGETEPGRKMNQEFFAKHNRCCCCSIKAEWQRPSKVVSVPILEAAHLRVGTGS